MVPLFNNAFAPLTFSTGFLEADMNRVAKSFARWQWMTLHRVNTQALTCSLKEGLGRLEPLDSAGQRVLWVATRSEFVAYFDNGFQGASPISTIAYLAEALDCTGLVCTYVPALGKMWPSLKFTLISGRSSHPMRIQRAISLIKDVDGWQFAELGPPLPFEEVGRYQSPKKADRFTGDMLKSYCQKVGVEPFDESFYLNNAILQEVKGLISPAVRGKSLLEVRSEMGLA